MKRKADPPRQKRKATAQFCQGFTNHEIVSILSTQLSWSHFIELLPIKDPLAREFYAEMCRIERWDVRMLRLKIGGMLFQRTALSRKPQAVISAEIAKLRDGQMSPDLVFRDPYLIDFCGHEPVLQLHKKLCRHYWNIDPAATADYINAYRERWDSDEPGGRA